jgi:hypothetical protein
MSSASYLSKLGTIPQRQTDNEKESSLNNPEINLKTRTPKADRSQTKHRALCQSNGGITGFPSDRL